MATDTHIVMVPSAGGPVPTPLPHPFVGMINGALSSDVNIMGKPAATVDSTADNSPAHIPGPPGTAFQKPPANKATIKIGSPTVFINGKMAARNGDTAMTCELGVSTRIRAVATPTWYLRLSTFPDGDTL